MTDNDFNTFFAEPISIYTRKDAPRDGYLIDVTEKIRDAGFKVPVALTRAVWVDCVEWTDDDNRRKCIANDEAGRLWDVVYMAGLAVRARSRENRVPFQVYRVPQKGKGHMPRLVDLVIAIGPGDNSEPVITIMFPRED